jgi:hypothetical protein
MRFFSRGNNRSNRDNRETKEIGIEGNKLVGLGAETRDLDSLFTLMLIPRSLINSYKLVLSTLQAKDILILLHHLSDLHYNLILASPTYL